MITAAEVNRISVPITNADSRMLKKQKKTYKNNRFFYNNAVSWKSRNIAQKRRHIVFPKVDTRADRFIVAYKTCACFCLLLYETQEKIIFWSQ